MVVTANCTDSKYAFEYKMSILGYEPAPNYFRFDAATQVVTIETSKDNIDELLNVMTHNLSIQIDFVDTSTKTVLQTQKQNFTIKFNTVNPI